MLSKQTARYLPTIFGCGNTRFFQPVCVENICFDGFSLTGSLKNGGFADTLYNISNEAT